uniref:hypothetical protein n=1 Tax=Chlorococcum tatrense TaxID=915274 RepID=UPI0010C4B9A4|nr:hypothetical protein [Chlorococcum tatrense]AYQ94359.1 hypothetical protein [Chlorococcum tatrense]
MILNLNKYSNCSFFSLCPAPLAFGQPKAKERRLPSQGEGRRFPLPKEKHFPSQGEGRRFATSLCCAQRLVFFKNFASSMERGKLYIPHIPLKLHYSLPYLTPQPLLFESVPSFGKRSTHFARKRGNKVICGIFSGKLPSEGENTNKSPLNSHNSNETFPDSSKNFSLSEQFKKPVTDSQKKEPDLSSPSEDSQGELQKEPDLSSLYEDSQGELQKEPDLSSPSEDSQGELPSVENLQQRPILKTPKSGPSHGNWKHGKSRNVSKMTVGVKGKDKKPRKSGEQHGNWKHGEGKTRGYDSLKYAAWKEGVLMRFNFRCIVTGEKTDLACHHLKSWDWCVEGRYDIDNGVVVKKEIHEKFHQVYGGGQNTPEQFNDFLKTNYNISENSWQHGNHEPSLTTEKIQERRLTQAQKLHEALLKLIKSRNHVLVSGVYENSSSIIEVRCLIHNPLPQDKISSSSLNEENESVVGMITHKTTATNYKKSKTGMPCCGRAIQSEVTAFHNTRRRKS